MYTNMYIYIYIYACIHTYMHISIYLHILLFLYCILRSVFGLHAICKVGAGLAYEVWYDYQKGMNKKIVLVVEGRPEAPDRPPSSTLMGPDGPQ